VKESPQPQPITAIQEDVCWAIGNIAGDSDEYRAVLLQCGALQPIVDLLLRSLFVWRDIAPGTSDSTAVIQHSRASTAMWAVSNMARGSTDGAAFLNSGR
jgi:hypothetical protein